ncbi:MAG: protease HtpX [Vicinamibacterales bacterium]
MKRIILFLATNLAIMVTLSVVLSLLGVGGYLTPTGLDYSALMVFALIWGMGGAFISLQISRWMAKRAMGVQLVDGKTGQAELDWFYRTVETLARRASLPMPEVGVYESAEVNAFATGPSKNRSLVAVSSGLFRAMGHDEIEGVLAHEITHIQNGDMVTLALIQGVVNAFVIFFSRVLANLIRSMVDRRMSNLVFMLTTIAFDIVLGILGSIVVAWFSRAREFRADAGGAALAGRNNMIGALQRLAQNKQLVDTSQPAYATMKINGAKGFMSLFSTHPPLEERIRALQQS